MITLLSYSFEIIVLIPTICFYLRIILIISNKLSYLKEKVFNNY